MEAIIVEVITGLVAIITCWMTTRTKKSVDENHKQMNKALVNLTKESITKIYYDNLDDKTLKEYERESLDALFDGYVEMGGNTFVKDIYSQMRNWKVIR